jgi:hypothetical protein
MLHEMSSLFDGGGSLMRFYLAFCSFKFLCKTREVSAEFNFQQKVDKFLLLDTLMGFDLQPASRPAFLCAQKLEI